MTKLKRAVIALALILILVSAAAAVSYTQNNTFNIGLNVLISKFKPLPSYLLKLNSFFGRLQKVPQYILKLTYFTGLAKAIAPYVLKLTTLFSKLQSLPKYTLKLTYFAGLATGTKYALSVNVCCNLSIPPPPATTTMFGNVSYTAPGGLNVIIPNQPGINFAIMLSLVGVPAILLGSVAGPAGLFVGLLIGSGLGFAAGLMPLWFLLVIIFALIAMLAIMRRREE